MAGMSSVKRTGRTTVTSSLPFFRYSVSACSTSADRLAPSSMARCLTSRTRSGGRYTLNWVFSTTLGC